VRFSRLAFAVVLATFLQAGAAHAAPVLAARAALLVEADTGAVVYSRDAGAELPIASTTKLMTAYVTLQRTTLTQRLVVQPYSPTTPGESLAGLAAGERLPTRSRSTSAARPGTSSP
jgi:D-alanyl-D-alanine carboxypeptidase (penicillin-binding protein 5/6)